MGRRLPFPWYHPNCGRTAATCVPLTRARRPGSSPGCWGVASKPLPQGPFTGAAPSLGGMAVRFVPVTAFGNIDSGEGSPICSVYPGEKGLSMGKGWSFCRFFAAGAPSFSPGEAPLDPAWDPAQPAVWMDQTRGGRRGHRMGRHQSLLHRGPPVERGHGGCIHR